MPHFTIKHCIFYIILYLYLYDSYLAFPHSYYFWFVCVILAIFFICFTQLSAKQTHQHRETHVLPQVTTHKKKNIKIKNFINEEFKKISILCFTS